jgi:hypothetical protein
MMDEYSKSSIQPYPQSVGSRLLNSLAFMTSGIGAGATGKENMAAKEHTDQINQWLETQKFNIDHKKAAAEGYQQLSQKFLDLGMSKRQAFDATDLAIAKKAALDSEKLVAARGDKQALATFYTNAGAIRDDLAQKQMALTKSTNEAMLQKAQTAQAYAATRHENAETANLNLTAGLGAAARTGQQNLANKVPFAALPQDQKQALVQHAQQNKMLIPGVGITQREITPDEQAKVQALELVNKLTTDIDGLVKGKIASPGERIQAASKANLIADLLPKVIGSQARVSPAIAEAFKNVVPSNPGALTTLWNQYGQAIKSSVGESRAALHKNLGTTFFNPIQFKPNG